MEFRRLRFSLFLAPEYGEENWHNFEQLASKIAYSLKTGSKFVLDLFDWNSIVVGDSFQEWNLRLEKKVVALSKYTRFEKAVVCKRKILEPDFVIAREFEIYWQVFEREELISIMQPLGLELVHECFEFDLSQSGSWQPQFKRRRLVVVFEKK